MNNLQQTLNQTLKPQSQELGISATLHWETVNQDGQMLNVLGLIPGQDPTLKHEIVILGAHRDHFGRQAGVLFPGADDNASGTAVMLEVARQLSRSRTHLKRSVLVVSFSGEERDLLGSKLYVNQPIHELKKTVAMINIDHVGIGNGKLTVGVTKLPKSTGQQAADLVGLGDKVELYGFFPGGDHVPFFKAGVPTVTVVSSGTHPAFHQSSDTADTMQPKILETAVRYVLAITWLLANPS